MKEVSKCKHFFAWLFLGKYLPINDKYNLRCSRCGHKMNKVKKEDVVIDVCNNCGGMFLDDGEINKLSEIASKNKTIKKVKNDAKQ